MSNRIAYLNGEFVPEKDLKIHAFDLSVMQAAAAFEMTRSFNGTTFRLVSHLERLVRSCEALSIPCPWSVTELTLLCHALIDANDHGPGEEHRLLIVVSPGCAPMYKELDGVISHPFIYIADFPLRYTVAGFGRYFTDGVHAMTSAVQQVPDVCVPSQAKHRSRLHFHLAQSQAPTGFWPLLTDHARYYTEAPGANLVYVRRGQVFTLEENCLQGISLGTIKELIPTQPNVLHRAETGRLDIDELWLCGTPFCVVPVVSVDGQPVGDGTIGPVYREVLAKWSNLVGVDIANQIIAWDAGEKSSQIWTPDAQRTVPA